MACIITLTTGNNETVEVEVPSLPNSLQELRLYINENKYSELKAKIKTVIGQGKLIKSQVLSEIKETNKVIPNTNVGSLRSRFPKVSFPEGFDNIPVLFINYYTTLDLELLFGIVENSNGEKVFVIDNNFVHLERFANYLSLLRSVEEDNILLKIDKDSKDLLERCKEASKISSVKEMVILYLNNKDIFRDFRTSKDESVFERLDSLLTNLGYKSRRKEFTNPTAQELYVRFNINPHSDFVTIPLKELYEQVLKFDSEISKVIPDTFTKFQNFLKSEESTDAFDNLFPGENSKIERILDFIMNKEPWMNYEFISNNKGTLKLKESFPSVKRVYGIGFETIKTMPFVNYRGYYIFTFNNNGLLKYFPSFEYLSEASKSEAFNNIEEAKSYIDTIIGKENISNYLPFKLLYLDGNGKRSINKYLPEGSLVRVRDYPISFGKIYPKNELELLLYGNMEDFEAYMGFLAPKVLDYINNPLDAMLFIYEINNKLKDKRDSTELLVNIAKEISLSQYRNFYIESTYKDSSGTRYQKVIESKDNNLDEFKKDNKVPVIGLFNAVKQVFGNKFGVEVEVLNNDEIKLKYNVEGAKAFLVNDKIVLNSTLASSGDIFHEYSHLVLGYLKKINYEGYIKLMESTWNLLSPYIKNRVQNKYKSLPRSSMYEEGFVIAFGNFISDNRINNDLKNLFKELSNFIIKGTSSIFDGETNIYKIFGNNIQSVFRRFNLEVGHLLDSGEDFLSFVKSDEFFLQRKKINWLEKQISDGKVEEKC